MQSVADRNRNMEFLRTVNTPDVNAATLNGGLLSVSRFVRRTPGHGMSEEHAQEDAYMLSLQRHDYQGDLWVDGKRVDFGGSKAGNFTLYDYSRAWRADLRTEFDCVNFHISRRALLSLEEEIGPRPFDGFNLLPGADITDAVVQGIVNSVVPILERQSDTSQLMLDYIGTGLLIHLASVYGGVPEAAGFVKGGLTPRQLSRARALLDANLDGRLNLADIAKECGLSPSYFARAFKVSTGTPPHKWMMERRLDKAADLMRNSALSLNEIALACGFSDQPHFTRAFHAARGMSPAAWRKDAVRSHSVSLFDIPADRFPRG